MVGAYGVDLLDFVAEGHGLVDEELDKIMRRRLSGEEFELVVNGAGPRGDDAKRDLARRNQMSIEVARQASECGRRGRQ